MSELPKIAGRTPEKVSLEEGKNYAYCTCGLSASQPFCDGGHKGTEYKPIVFTADADTDMHVCMCKRTANGPRCDGTHNSLPAES